MINNTTYLVRKLVDLGERKKLAENRILFAYIRTYLFTSGRQVTAIYQSTLLAKIQVK